MASSELLRKYHELQLIRSATVMAGVIATERHLSGNGLPVEQDPLYGIATGLQAEAEKELYELAVNTEAQEYFK